MANDYLGNVMTKDFIAFLALNNDLQFLMVVGALFQALVASFMNVQVDFSEKPSSINLPLEIDLELRIPSFISHLFIAKLWLGRLTDFHISVSLVLAFNWFTEHMFNFFRMLSLETLSEILFLFRNHNSLF